MTSNLKSYESSPNAHVPGVSPTLTTDRATGYLHPLYAESFSAYGVPQRLNRSCGWIVKRRTPALEASDAMGCYPIFCCGDWQGLGEDLQQLQDDIVSLALVTDPLGTYQSELLHSLFDVVRPYKQHFVADLSLPLEQFTSARHRKCGRKALRKFSVEICSDPLAHLDEWVWLYGQLITRHRIHGMRCFSREAFAKQLSVPGLVSFRATEGREPLSLDLWYVQGDVAQAHLVGTSPRGYELQASYGLKLFILRYFAGKVRWANLGAAPGESAGANHGLANFKRGWASETRTAFFCGKVLNPAVYQELVRANRAEDTGFFPAYRCGEFA
jgi:hypothetical protein